jgi:hypothetical protein
MKSTPENSPDESSLDRMSSNSAPDSSEIIATEIVAAGASVLRVKAATMEKKECRVMLSGCGVSGWMRPFFNRTFDVRPPARLKGY